MKLPKKVITICSSASFYKQVIDIQSQLSKLGYKVKIPKTASKMSRNGDFNVDNYKLWLKDKNAYKIKTHLMDVHFKKVIASDAILVVNLEKKGIKGYIGGNALMEMVLAYHYKKPIYIWNPIDNSSPFEEEIIGLKSIFINQDLSKINFK
jgi:diphthamide synthase subunit DPH2